MILLVLVFASTFVFTSVIRPLLTLVLELVLASLMKTRLDTAWVKAINTRAYKICANSKLFQRQFERISNTFRRPIPNERHSSAIKTIWLPGLARALLTLIGLCRIHAFEEKTSNSRKGQRTSQTYRNLEGSDQQMQRLEETELRKADRTVGVPRYRFSNISSGTA